MVDDVLEIINNGAIMVDIHAHLVDEQFRYDLDSVLKEAKACGVGYIIAVSENGELVGANPWYYFNSYYT